jgi:hypothetical protein
VIPRASIVHLSSSRLFIFCFIILHRGQYIYSPQAFPLTHHGGDLSAHLHDLWVVIVATSPRTSFTDHWSRQLFDPFVPPCFATTRMFCRRVQWLADQPASHNRLHLLSCRMCNQLCQRTNVLLQCYFSQLLLFRTPCLCV